MDKKNIVIVDDSEFEAQLSMMVLQGAFKSLNIVHLKDGRELVDYLNCEKNFQQRKLSDNNSIKLILLDINMPRMSGLEALSVIRGNKSFSGIPIAMLSSSETPADVLNSYKLGANSYIKKAVDFIEFRETMSQTAQYWLNINHSVFQLSCY